MEAEAIQTLIDISEQEELVEVAELELKALEQSLAEAEKREAVLREALTAIDGPCEKLTSHRCIDDGQFVIGAEFGADAVCYPCIANRALADTQLKRQ